MVNMQSTEVQLDDFGRIIKQHRKGEHLSQRDFADLMEVSQSQISMIETEKLSPNIHILKNFAKLKGKELVILFRDRKGDVKSDGSNH